MPWPFAIVVMGLMLAGMYYYLRLVVRLFARAKTTLQERGHKSPALHGTLLAIAFVLPFLITLATLGYGNENGLFVIAALFVALPVMLVLGARRVPRRNARTAGRRRVRFPYRLAGYVLCLAGLTLWITGAATNTNGWFQLGTVTIGAGLGCLAIARRASLPDATTVMARDPRAPVIYLRPFHKEEEIFAQLPWSLRRFGFYLRQSFMRRRSLHQTLEDFLGQEITKRIGPFIALGNPTDFVPPDGAARTYVADEDWPRHFDAMAQRARCLVLLAASSDHVVWELSEIRSLHLETKLFVLTRPKLTAKTKIAPWRTFASALRHAGYPPCVDDAGPGAVVGFNPGGEPVILKRDAKTAAETVDVLCARLGLTADDSSVQRL